MQIDTIQTGSPATAAVSGRVDSSNAQEFEQGLLAALEEGQGRLALDCGELAYMSSAGLRALLIGVKKASARGGELVCCQVPDRIRELLQVSGFTRFIKLFDSAEAAQSSLSNP